MRALLQRVSRASVEVDGKIVGEIGAGLLIFLGVATGDVEAQAQQLADKVANLRIFPDLEGKMNLSVRDTGGACLIVSQFTLYGDTRRGRRPSFDNAARPEIARTIYELFVESIRRSGVRVETGVFQAHMMVSLANDGPVTLLCES